MRRIAWSVVSALVILAVLAWQGSLPELLQQSGIAVPGSVSSPQPQSSSRTALPDFLPAEARTTLDLIQRQGPFPHAQDGSVFGNRERLLPQKPRGYYREFTVATPSLRHRGARRIVTGGDPPEIWYYTDDHYRSFRSFEVPR